LAFGVWRWRLVFDVRRSPFNIPPFPPREQLLMAVVGWAVSDENEMKKENEKDTYGPRTSSTSRGPLSCRRSTCDPPHEQWLMGLGAGGVSPEMAASTWLVLSC